jgi:amino acid adenylation domain-containing protein
MSLDKFRTLKMTVANYEKVSELTPTQQAMLAYALYAPESKAYLEQFCYSYHGPLNLPAFVQVWQRVIERHASLRTSFCWEDGDCAFQVVHPRVELPMELRDWRTLSSSKLEEQLTLFLEEDRNRGFDLTKAPLIRLSLIQTAEDAFYIVLSNHHIVLDGWSMGLVRSEVSQLYQSLVSGEQIDATPAPPQFCAYVNWLQKQDQKYAEAFWRRELVGFAAPNALPIDRAPGKLPGHEEVFAEEQICLPASLTADLQSSARRNRVTMSTFAQAAWAVLLNRYCGTDDVAFGITVSGRPYELTGVESMVGLLINTLPVRLQMSPEETVFSCFQKLQSKVAEIREHEHVSLKQIQGWSELPHNLPLFESLLVFENFAGYDSSFKLAGPIETVSSHLARTNYPLTLVVNPGAEMRLQLIYHRSRFEDDAILRMLSHLMMIFESFASNLEQPIADIELLTESERHTLIADWNSNPADLPDGRPIQQLFEKQVERTPEAVAVIHESHQLTYAELNARANQLAHFLRAAGVGPESLVGVCLERSIDMVVAVLAVLKAGGAYVPLDPVYPTDRLTFMLEDSGVTVLVTRESLRQRLSDYAGKTVSVDGQGMLVAACSKDNLVESVRLGNLAYVIYTSGSTGEPKGVMIEHKSLVNFALAAADEYAISASDRFLQFASLCFDISAEEIFSSLTRGAALVLRTDAMLNSAEQFLRSCGELGITVLDLPTAYWHHLAAALRAENLAIPDSLRLVILGGEQALPAHVATWLEHADENTRLVNTYGPTETTVVATACDLSGRAKPISSSIPIGRPIRNAAAYVLDRFLKPVPIGVAGELYIGGAGVARGYHNRPELTAEKFIPNPFSDGSARLYRTGDVVRYRSDGNLEFLGRKDNQVKIRGFRVELEEIEQAIRTHESVSDAVVVAREDDDDNKRLCAYVVTGGASQPTPSDLRGLLKKKLPPHMLPAAILIVESLPLMPNGKIDRQSLPDPGNQRPEVEEGFVAPGTPMEECLAKAWRDALKLVRVGIHDNFFELGGHSLLAARVVSNLRRNFDIKLSLIDVFQAPTIAVLAELIYQRQADAEKNDDLISLLSELQSLSNEEARQRLAEELETVDASGNRPTLSL